MAQYTKTYYATQDTYIDRMTYYNQGGTNTNYDGRSYLEIYSKGTTEGSTILLGIDTSEALYKKINSSYLYMYLESPNEIWRLRSMVAYIEAPWDAKSITGINSKEKLKNSGWEENGFSMEGRYFVVDLTSVMRKAQKKGSLKYGWTLESLYNENDVFRFTSIEGGKAPYIRVAYEDAPPLKPTIYEPINIFVNNNENILFKWKYSSEIPNDFQQGIEIRVKHELGNWYTAYSSAAYSQEEINLTPTQHKLETGKNEWQIRTCNQFGEWSSWSEVVSFNALGLPNAPTVNVVQEGARPIINWTATYQQVYQVQVLDNNNEIVHDSGSIASLSNKIYKVPVFLPNGNYTARVRIKNEFDLFSNWGTKAFTITTTPKEPFNIIIQNVNSNVMIRYTKDADYYLIYRKEDDRDFQCVGRTEQKFFTDYTVKGETNVTYFIRAVIAEEYVDSNRKSTITYCKYPIIAIAGDYKECLELKSSYNEPRRRNYTLENVGKREFFTGREFAVKEFNEFKDNAYAVNFYIRNEELPKLERIYNRKTVILYKDNYRKIFGTIEGGIQVESVEIGGYNLRINLSENDYNEVIKI